MKSVFILHSIIGVAFASQATSASIKVLGGVAKWRHRVLLLRLCVATAILPEKKRQKFGFAEFLAD